MKSKSKGIIGLIILAVITAVVCFAAAVGFGSDNKFGVKNIKKGLDLSGGVSIVYEAVKEDVTADEMEASAYIIQSRLDRKNWTEAEVQRQGERRIRVEIPGIEDAEEAVKELGRTAQLLFVDESGYVILDGGMVKNAKKEVGQLSQNSASQPYVTLEFNEEGTRLFADATKANMGKPIYIIMDDEIISAPVVGAHITDGHAVISGSFTPEYAQELADLIKEGAMPSEFNIIEMNNIGARLGSNAIETSIKAAIVGIALVLLFMLIFYRVGGFAADWALVIYIALEIAILSIFNITLTLPGIAGVILSVGMAVDANVIIFERLKEEISAGTEVNEAVKVSFSKALPAILDGNITTIIAAAILYLLGTGTIKGFAITLAIGIVLSMFTAIFITRFTVSVLVGIGFDKPSFYSVKKSAIEGGDSNGCN